MTGGAPSVPLTNLRNLALSRALVAVVAVLGVLLAVTLLAEGSGLPPRTVLLLAAAVSAPVVAALAWSVVARWGDRVEVWPDRAVRWKGGRSEAFYWRDIASTRARLGGEGGLFSADPFGVRVETGDKRWFAVEGVTPEEAAPLLRAINEEMLGRWFGALRQGGEVVSRDAPRVPWLRLTWLVVITAVAGVDALVLADRVDVALLGNVVVVAGAWRGSWRALRTWLRARKVGGVRLSAEGIRPVADASEGTLAVAPYRDAPAGSVTPWSMVESASVDGYCMEIRCRDRAEPLVLSGATENLFVVYEFLRVMFSGGAGSFPRPD